MKSKSNKKAGFESKYERLEEILDMLENEADKIPLEDMLNYYQEGLKLVKECRSLLTEVELKIEKINEEEKKQNN